MVATTTRDARFAPKTLAALTKLLLARRASVAGCAEALRIEVEDALSRRDLSDLLDHDDPSADSDATTALMLAEWVERRLWEVDGALARVADGTYGYCLHCGGPIPLKRLRALPATGTCVACSHGSSPRAHDRQRARTNKIGGRSLAGFGPPVRRVGR
ncbi:MAG: TraR/DksA C4-type zinc finger protein [Acidimicrobiia bacterium]|nr:TraR/DksA C4-type zinc finger protein [Acidimicrobiia bacterium]